MMNIKPLSVYAKCGRLIAKEVESEFIITPVEPCKSKVTEELYFLNETGRELWERLDGKHTLDQLIKEISYNYISDFHEQIRSDLCDLTSELLDHGIIKEVG